MRHTKILLLLLARALACPAQLPITASQTYNSSILGYGATNFFHWYEGTPTGGCTNTLTGLCVGPTLQGDFYYFSGWLPNASGLPVTTGLPVVGTVNDYAAVGCNGNIGVLQLDKWSWTAPTASHVERVNCMPSYGAGSGTPDAPAGWHGHMTSSDNGTGPGTWKNRTIFSLGGKLYLPVERQISTGQPGIHDATFVMSPDSGQHWCNPYTYFSHSGSPGCDSSNWQADGDAPKCDAANSTSPCTNAGYTDSSHSSMMWKALPYGTEAWNWVNFGVQDGQPYPTGIPDGADPNTYAYFTLFTNEGSLARVPINSILDISAWQYYTCPAIATGGLRCPLSSSGSWTGTFADRTPVMALTYATATFGDHLMPQVIPFNVMYVKEFHSYMALGIFGNIYWAPALNGPWTMSFESGGGSNMIAPALGYTVVSPDPPHVQLTAVSNSYGGIVGCPTCNGAGSPQFTIWDLIQGRTNNGSAFQVSNRYTGFNSGDGYQIDTGNVAGGLPRNGLIWAFDLADRGSQGASRTNWPYFIDRGGSGAVLAPCNNINPYTPSLCFQFNPGTGTNLYSDSISSQSDEYQGHFQVFGADSMASLVGQVSQTGYGDPTSIGVPAAMQGNGSYSVAMVINRVGAPPFSRTGSFWFAGAQSGSDNTSVNFGHVNGTLKLAWNGSGSPRYEYNTAWTMPTGNWYFVVVTVQAQAGGCGSNCTPAAKIWVAGANTAGVIEDVNAGVTYTAAGGASTKTPAVSSTPFVVGINSQYNVQAAMQAKVASLFVYGRVLSQAEVGYMYTSVKAKMAKRGVTLQ